MIKMNIVTLFDDIKILMIKKLKMINQYHYIYRVV